MEGNMSAIIKAREQEGRGRSIAEHGKESCEWNDATKEESEIRTQIQQGQSKMAVLERNERTANKSAKKREHSVITEGKQTRNMK